MSLPQKWESIDAFRVASLDLVFWIASPLLARGVAMTRGLRRGLLDAATLYSMAEWFWIPAFAGMTKGNVTPAKAGVY